MLLAGLGLSVTLDAAEQTARSVDERIVSLPDVQKPSFEVTRKAVIRALPLLVKASFQEYPKHRECFSCHNQAVPDGTWLVKSRSHPFQTYFESGFPHGPDQFISVAASGWATAALVLACPKA
jgi:hypothetical protein